MPTDIQRLMHLSKRERYSIPLESIRGIGSRLFVALFLQGRIGCSSLKEVHKGPIKMSQGLLERHRRDLCQPGILLLKRGEHGCQIVTGEALSMLKIGRLASRKAPIVDEAAAPKRLSKDDLLLSSRIEPVLVGPLRLGAHGLFALSLFLEVLFNGRQDFTIERAIILFGNRSYLCQQRSWKPNGQRLYLIFHVAILTLNWLHDKGLQVPLPKPKQGTALISPWLKQGVSRDGLISHQGNQDLTGRQALSLFVKAHVFNYR
jgi:hypothetical protein